MTEYMLKIAQSGFAAGEAFLIDNPRQPGETQPAADKETELARLDAALSALRKEFSDAASNESGADAEILKTEGMFLEDADFVDAMRAGIEKEGLSASAAVKEAGDALAEEIGHSGSEYLRERSEDIRGITERLTGILGKEPGKKMSGPSVLVTEELSPAMLVSLDRRLLLGIVTVKGSAASHVSILAGSLGIPYLYGSEEAVAGIREGDRLILDGGRLVIRPDEETWRLAGEKAEKRKEEQKKRLSSEITGACRTKICANIAGPSEIDALVSSGADGAGLFRSEFLFLNHLSAPTEDEQFEAYRKVAEAMGEKEVIIRTMDLGSDKMPEWLSLSEEKNPALGLRGIRVSLQEESLFRVQLRALLRAAACGNVKVMLPMIASPWEVDAARALMESCAEELAGAGIPHRIPPLGIMIETPAAVMIADELAAKADFFSIGTNDLTQYTLAVDREGEGLDRYFDTCHEAVFRLIEMTAAAAHKKNIPVGICGELAGNEKAVKRLVGAGIDELSVSVRKVGAVRALAFRAEQDCRTAEKAKNMPAAISAPADGRLIPMEDIPDPAFSSGSLGAALGIMPENGTVYAPCDGIISSVAETRHAVTIAASDGRNILVHAGIDTVRLAGKGMTVFVKEGDAVSAGQKLLETDLGLIRDAGFSPMVIVVELR